MRKKWRKILYEEQGVPDNYVDQSFLEELEKNLYIRTYDFWAVVIESGIVTQQISSVCIFVVAFIYMYNRILSPLNLFAVTVIFTLLGYALHAALIQTSSEKPSRSLRDDIKTALTFIAFGFGMSPLLMTLTETISTDTIYAMTTAMLLAHLLFHDYGADSALVSQPVSINAAMFASVCLASRLPTFLHTFATVTLAVAVFALWPSLRKQVKTSSQFTGQICMTVLLGLCAGVALYSISHVSAVLFILGHIFITFICPAWLIRLQPYKNNIYGPWDEAVVKD